MVKDIAILGLVCYVFLWNAAGVPGSPVRLSERERILGNLLALDQEWGMFAPFPSKNGGWYVIPGRLRNGKVVDLFNDGAPVTWAKPPLVSATFKSFRWQKYMQTIRNQQHAAYRKYYGAYLCRAWNRGHTGELQLTSLEVVYVLEMTLPNYEYFTPTKVVAFTHECAG
jgi:hypothetical protein